MKNKKTRHIIPLLIFFMAGHIFGQIKITGKIWISTARGGKAYQAVMTITQVGIVIECREKVFQLLNEFNAPRHRKVKVKTAELSGIVVCENTIYIHTKDAFFFRYRNVFVRCWQIASIRFGPKVIWAIVFVPDDPGAVGADAKKLIKAINEQ
jgi:hypothetical protein